VALLSVHGLLLRWIAEDGRSRQLRTGAAALAAVGCASFAVGVIGVARGSVFGVNFLLTPLSLCAGTGAIAYAASLARGLQTRRRSERALREPRWLPAASRILVLLFIVPTCSGPSVTGPTRSAGAGPRSWPSSSRTGRAW